MSISLIIIVRESDIRKFVISKNGFRQNGIRIKLVIRENPYGQN